MFSFVKIVSLVALVAPVLVSSAAIGPVCNDFCDVSKETIPGLDKTTPALVPPKNAAAFWLIGIGTQNYTCGADGKFAAAGAVADLFDGSCLQTKKKYSTVSAQAFKKFSSSKTITPAQVASSISGLGQKFGTHYFVKNAANGTSPLWEAQSVPGALKGDPQAVTIQSKLANSAPPTGGDVNVDWLSLVKVSGGLASEVFRVDTQGGKAPATCTPGQTTQVKYTSTYVLTQDAVKRPAGPVKGRPFRR